MSNTLGTPSPDFDDFSVEPCRVFNPFAHLQAAHHSEGHTTLEEKLELVDAALNLMNTRRHDGYNELERLRYDYTVCRNSIIIDGGDPSEVSSSGESFQMWMRSCELKEMKSKIIALQDRQASMHLSCFEMSKEREYILQEMEKRTADNETTGISQKEEPERTGYTRARGVILAFSLFENLRMRS